MFIIRLLGLSKLLGLKSLTFFKPPFESHSTHGSVWGQA